MTLKVCFPFLFVLRVAYSCEDGSSIIEVLTIRYRRALERV